MDGANPSVNHEDKALDLVSELLKLIPSTSGIMLALIWGLAGDSTPDDVLRAIRIASIVLVIAIFIAFVGLQFVLGGLEKRASWVSKRGAVQATFMLAEVAFLLGCAIVIWSLFLL
jgi:hypothetical protein